MSGLRARVDLRTVVVLILLDAISYLLLYWVLLPAFDEVVAVLNPTTAVGVGHVLSAVRLAFVGVLAARSYRSRRGVEHRAELVPSIAVGGVSAMLLQLVVGYAVGAYIGGPQTPLWLSLLVGLEWIVFPLLGILFVQPAPPDRIRLRRVAGARERGSVSVAAIPVAAGLVALTLILILILGSATSDRRESTAAADAAALAAVQEWDHRLGRVFGRHVGLTDHLGFWGLVGLPVLGDGVAAQMKARAEDFAARNGARLTSFSIDANRREVTVEVENVEAVPKTNEKMTGRATAQVRLTGGLCAMGTTIGYLVNGACVTSAPAQPTPEPVPTPTPTPGVTPTPTPTPTPTLPPFEAPSVAPYSSDVVLVG